MGTGSPQFLLHVKTCFFDLEALRKHASAQGGGRCFHFYSCNGDTVPVLYARDLRSRTVAGSPPNTPTGGVYSPRWRVSLRGQLHLQSNSSSLIVTRWLSYF